MSENTRRCILSGEREVREGLIRLALGPDGQVAPDVRARAPGRGAWIGVDRAAFQKALENGKLKGGLVRAYKTSAFTLSSDLPDRIETALQQATLDRLGLEARAGMLVTGSEKIEVAARRGQVHMLLHAADAASDGNRKLDQALRVGNGMEGTDLAGTVLPVDRAPLSMAMGRDNVVHIAIIDKRAADRVSEILGRWQLFLGCANGAQIATPASQGAPNIAVDE